MSKQRQKGTAFETAIVNWFKAQGVEARRLPLAGAKDEGDVVVDEFGLGIEAKNCRQLALSQWVTEADAESLNSGRPVVVVAKRVGKGDPGEAYVIMPLRRLYRLLKGYDGTSDEEAATQ